MKRREAGECSSVIGLAERVYKGSRKFSEFVTRFLGTREESIGIVVYEKEIAKGAVI